jgi:hypothetical protein
MRRILAGQRCLAAAAYQQQPISKQYPSPSSAPGHQIAYQALAGGT